MDVELAQERILVFADRFSMDHAEGRAWAQRADAFGTMAKLGGLFNKQTADSYECVYRERRLQPFWKLHCTAVAAYERTRDYAVPVAAPVQSVVVAGESRAVTNREFRISGVETCRENSERTVFYDGLGKGEAPALANYLKYEASEATTEQLAEASAAGTVVVPPESKASSLVREVVSTAIGKIDADRILEEKVTVDAVDLYYRPVYAFRYRHSGREAVIEFDSLTGEAKPGGATFEQYLGKALEPKFLLDASVEAVNLFVPGTQLARIVVQHGVKHIMDQRQKS